MLSQTCIKIFWKMWVTKQLLVTANFDNRKKKILCKSLGPATVTNILQNILQETHSDLNNLKVSKWWQNFHFWVNYEIKYHSNTKTVVNFRFCAPHSSKVTTLHRGSQFTILNITKQPERSLPQTYAEDKRDYLTHPAGHTLWINC